MRTWLADDVWAQGAKRIAGRKRQFFVQGGSTKSPSTAYHFSFSPRSTSHLEKSQPFIFLFFKQI
jgi:hypothetical protein